VRGGAWLGDPAFLRSASRYDDSPVVRSSLIGFRVVCSSPIA
jgi:formylglycine-generating enzyme required for sulfatase activity